MTVPLRLGVVYDFRNPPDSGIDIGMGYAPHEFSGFGMPVSLAIG